MLHQEINDILSFVLCHKSKKIQNLWRYNAVLKRNGEGTDCREEDYLPPYSEGVFPVYFLKTREK